jgi:undecaprenyl diphosphate synthase
MEQKILPSPLPHHIAIICDGNRRWAEKKNLPLQAGHYKGAGKIKEVIEWAINAQIPELSLFVLSIDNFKRPQHEIDYLLQLPLDKIKAKELEQIKNSNIQVRVIGRKDNLPEDLLSLIYQVTTKTQGNTGLIVNFCFNYSSEDELLKAVNTFSATAEKFQDRLMLKSDVDLLIRTGGRSRLSNFLLYQSRYAEIYFSPTFWPSFSQTEFLKILTFYSQQERTFGGQR